MSRECALAQRSSNIFGAPDSNDQEALLRRKEKYRIDLETQMANNSYIRRETVNTERGHPLETRVQKISIRKKSDQEEINGEFVIGKEGKTSSEKQKEKVLYQERLTEDLRNKKEYLATKEENDLRNRKPVQRSHSPVLEGEFVIGAESLEYERNRRDNARAFNQDNGAGRHKEKRLGEEDHSGMIIGDEERNLSKKDRQKHQYKKELDEQVDLYNHHKNAELERIRDEDRYNARQNLPYTGNADADVRRKQKIAERQEFLEKASSNYPTQRPRDIPLDKNTTFTIGGDNMSNKYISKQQRDYKTALDEQLGVKARRLVEEKEKTKLDDERYARQGLPYLDNHDDDK